MLVSRQITLSKVCDLLSIFFFFSKLIIFFILLIMSLFVDVEIVTGMVFHIFV